MSPNALTKKEKITLDYALKLNPRLNPDLFMPDPKSVMKKMNASPIREWLDFLSTEYEVKTVRNIVLIPCSFYKPYNPPHDQFYRRINDVRKKVRKSKFLTVSVPLALEPEEFWDFQWNGVNLIYDCPFFPWIENFGYEWDHDAVEQVFAKLAQVVKRFFMRNEGKYERVIALFVPSSDELKYMVREFADIIVPHEEPRLEVSYNNNTSEVYCHPDVWSEFLHVLRSNRIL